MRKLLAFAKREFVFMVALAAAMFSMAFVPIDGTYASYVDFRIIALLFSLMLVIQGLIRFGLFSAVSRRLAAKAGSVKSLAMILVCSVFLFSMLVTNDVSLLTFVPLTLMVYPKEDRGSLRFIIVMETIAANLGSMAFPFGNPQNLYLYTYYRMPFGVFFKVVFPVTLSSLGMILLVVSVHHYEGMLHRDDTVPVSLDDKKLGVSLVLFALCIMTALRLLDYRLTLCIVSVCMLFLDRKSFGKVDYGLLGTFVFFFVFVGNLGRIPSVTRILRQSIQGREFLYGVLASQVISNVPAAILLSHFTTNSAAIVLGTDIGGLGTLVASLASLISFKIYGRSGDAHKGRYLLLFTVWNFVFLLILSAFAIFILL
jgi:Na+/H+ antiporter NhaD/arsenite permease-like protein